MSARTGSSGRWVLLVLMLGASGWASFTLYERTTRASVTAEPSVDPRVEQLVADGFKHLGVDELDQAAQKLDEAASSAPNDARVQEGLVLVSVRRAERLWWEVQLGDKSAKRLEELDHAVHNAREVIAKARRATTDAAVTQRITMVERQLNTMLFVAFVAAGATDRARGALSARLTTHPQHTLLERYVGLAPTPEPAASASASASATPPPPPPPVAVPFTGQGTSYEPHYELDHEPSMHNKPKTKGELLLPLPAPPSE